MSRGAIATIRERIIATLEQPMQEALALARQQPVAYVDETGVNRHAKSPHCRHEKVLTPRGRFSLCFDHGLGHCLGLFNSPKLFAMRH